MSRILTIRADCSPTMGTGHVMRMIALGQAWQALGGEVRFVGRTAPLTDRLKSERFAEIPLDIACPDPGDAHALLDATAPGDWIAIDGYHFDTAYMRTVRDAGRRTLVLDDFFDRHGYTADILLNQNPDGPDYPYDIPEATLLLGTKYALLRKEFQRTGPDKTVRQKATDILITLGGADPDNITGKVVDAINATGRPDLTVKVVAGAANPHLSDLRKRLTTLPCDYTLLTNVSDMPALMVWADLAVSAGGTTCWELCFFGVPFMAIEIADNQQGVIRELTRHKAARCLDSTASVGDIAMELERLIDNSPARQAMREAGMRLVDGKGALRVAKTICTSDISLRPVVMEDAGLLLQWRNNPEISKQFFDPSAISLDRHMLWLKKRIADSDCLFYIGEDAKKTPVGQIRFDREGSNAVISINVSPERFGQGIGTVLTKTACEKMRAAWPGTTLTARVKQNNPASLNMFVKAGFTTDDNDEAGYITLRLNK